MKKILSNVTKVTAGIAVAIAVISCSKQQPKSGSASTSAPSEKKNEIVFVNSDSLLNNYEYFREVRTKFEQKSKKAQSDLQAKGSAFQREVTAYQAGAANMSADQRATTEERLARKQQELAAFNQNASSALQNEEAAENEKLYNRVSAYLKTYAKEKGYKFVLTYSKANPAVLYAHESLDITKDVVAGLNAEYKKK